MQIDFHHTVTYVAARIAGFPPPEAEIIAYAAQYVDDATCSGVICFKNRAIYDRISSAHKSIDPKNLDHFDNQKVWMPFHFLPGNGQAEPGENPAGTFIHKLICSPDSPVAREMLQAAIADQNKPYSLHRLGITLHVYAETWAHQGFAGVLHEINEVDNLEETGDSRVFKEGLKSFVNRFLEKSLPPLGHGKALVFPDLPFLSWRYTNGHNIRVVRNNTELFGVAANALCQALQSYRGAAAVGIGALDMKTILNLFSSLQEEDGGKRHGVWLKALAAGNFTFGSATLSYAEDGPSSWKAEALGSSRDLPEYPYSEAFLQSNWKLFHDALQLHQFTVAHDILPRYGICAA